jgi:flavin-dependent dehydrogenase
VTLFHKDKEIHVSYIAYQGKSCKKYLWIFRDFLIEKHNLRIDRTTMTRGIIRNNMTACKSYLFGKGNVLIAGEACGIMEAIDPAMATGKAAGESILKSIETGRSALECYLKNELLLFEKELGEKTVERIRSDLGFYWYDRL